MAYAHVLCTYGSHTMPWGINGISHAFHWVCNVDTNNRTATRIVQKRIIEGIEPSIAVVSVLTFYNLMQLYLL